MKKITITLSDKAEAYFNEVKYSLDKGDGSATTNRDVINEILETNKDFEEVVDTSVSGWLKDRKQRHPVNELQEAINKMFKRYTPGNEKENN